MRTEEEAKAAKLEECKEFAAKLRRLVEDNGITEADRQVACWFAEERDEKDRREGNAYKAIRDALYVLEYEHNRTGMLSADGVMLRHALMSQMRFFAEKEFPEQAEIIFGAL